MFLKYICLYLLYMSVYPYNIICLCPARAIKAVSVRPSDYDVSPRRETDKFTKTAAIFF